MGQLWAALDGAWRVLLVGMILGAGLPALFAFGVRALAWGTGGEAEVMTDGVALKPHPVGRAIAYTIFAVVILAVLTGIGYIVAHGLGWTITFDGALPVLTRK
ncbi:hypothetical protein [Propionicimonas sp.]|uniref:hypothetical protein n=1 Tax=Propionicimonas sp. TaxID=1955623 RepID=UPI0039E5AFD5